MKVQMTRGLLVTVTRDIGQVNARRVGANSIRARMTVMIEDPEVIRRRGAARLLIQAYEKSISNRFDMIHMKGEEMEEPRSRKHDV
jgi:hypothetical protein